MTYTRLPAPDIAVPGAGPVSHHEPARAPIIVLTYPYSGAERLRALLEDRAELACTMSSGLLPFCEQAAMTWRRVEGRDGTDSALAVASVRAVTTTMITTLLARTGRSRWCEIASAPPEYAATFLKLYPDARFVCLHRNCADVILAAIRANPWGLSDPVLQPFAASYPGSSIAAMAAYWAACTGPLLDFERAHPASCRRVRYEEIPGAPGGELDGLLAFLDLAPTRTSTPGGGFDSAAAEGPDVPSGGAAVPVGHLAPPLRAHVSELLVRLQYPPLAGEPQ
jgi:protein-tyrosine sulfotransferase